MEEDRSVSRVTQTVAVSALVPDCPLGLCHCDNHKEVQGIHTPGKKTVQFAWKDRLVSEHTSFQFVFILCHTGSESFLTLT